MRKKTKEILEEKGRQTDTEREGEREIWRETDKDRETDMERWRESKTRAKQTIQCKCG
jgi:hypothetical protein